MRQGLMIYPHHMLQTLGKYGAAPFNSASHSGEAAAAAGLDDGMLTPRQQDVLLLLARGLSNKAIASQLEISESTVKVHIRAIMERTGMMNRTQIVAHFRSEEHTSELQSLMRISYAVFCLKKKKHTQENINTTIQHT